MIARDVHVDDDYHPRTCCIVARRVVEEPLILYGRC